MESDDERSDASAFAQMIGALWHTRSGTGLAARWS